MVSQTKNKLSKCWLEKLDYLIHLDTKHYLSHQKVTVLKRSESLAYKTLGVAESDCITEK